jgi:hypothetical protein
MVESVLALVVTQIIVRLLDVVVRGVVAPPARRGDDLSRPVLMLVEERFVGGKEFRDPAEHCAREGLVALEFAHRSDESKDALKIGPA